MTNIEWTDTTWQVTHGCKKIAAGCANCYAIRDAHRMAGHPNPKISGPRKGLTKVWRADEVSATKFRPVIDWTGVVRTAPENLDKPLRWKKPRRIFVNSNSDLFHPDVPFEYIAAVYGVMAACPQHTFQVLTKRPERMLEFFEYIEQRAEMAKAVFPRDSHEWRREHLFSAQCLIHGLGETHKHRAVDFHWPLPNVWHGVSVAEPRDLPNVEKLRRVPSAVRFISYEPALAEIDLRDHFWKTCRDCGGKMHVGSDLSACVCAKYSPRPGYERRNEIHWLIAGGESGPNARPCDVAWIRSIVEQCEAAGVAAFVKQVGSRPVGLALSRLEDRKGGDPSEWPEDIRVRQFPASAEATAGRPEVTRG